MPKLDKTGPRGKGAADGRGRGGCVKGQKAKAIVADGARSGRGGCGSCGGKRRFDGKGPHRAG